MKPPFRRTRSLSGSIVVDAKLREARKAADDLQAWFRRQDAAVQALPVHAHEDERPTLPPPRESATVRVRNPWERVAEEARRAK